MLRALDVDPKEEGWSIPEIVDQAREAAKKLSLSLSYARKPLWVLRRICNVVMRQGVA